MNAMVQLKCFADPVRLRILHLLARRGPELCVCDIVQCLALPQSTVSRHLMLLRHAALVQDRRSDMWVRYSLLPSAKSPQSNVISWLKQAAADEPVLQADLARYDALRAEGVTGCRAVRNPMKRRRAATAREGARRR